MTVMFCKCAYLIMHIQSNWGKTLTLDQNASVVIDQSASVVIAEMIP